MAFDGRHIRLMLFDDPDHTPSKLVLHVTNLRYDTLYNVNVRQKP